MLSRLMIIEVPEPNENGDPQYISNLLSPETERACYFLVGNRITGTSERIGAIPSMLIAHSQLLRRVLSHQVTELRERWDITLPQVSPCTFKRVLKFAYGCNNIVQYSIEETLDLLKAADMLVMNRMISRILNHIENIMSPSNVCEILQEELCLDYKKLEKEIGNLIQCKTKEVFAADNLQLVSPAGMRYIVLLEDLQVSQTELWRTVIKWARRKVLIDTPSPNAHLRALFEQELIVPCLMRTRLCLFNLISIVEGVLNKKKSEKDLFGLICTYHYVNITSPVNTVSICDVDSSKKTIFHHPYEVKVIYNCALWIKPDIISTSELIIQTPPSCGASLHSIICTGLSRKSEAFKRNEISEDDVLSVYECKCTVRTTLITDTEKTEISKVEFGEYTLFEEEFKILLKPKGKDLRLEPNSKYIMEISFEIPHPLWYSSGFRPGHSEDLVVRCGVVGEEKLWYGCHIKYLIYERFAVTP